MERIGRVFKLQGKEARKMTFINNFIEVWVKMIDRPLTINNKQGFLLTNGMRIFFKDTFLSQKSIEILKRHYSGR